MTPLTPEQMVQLRKRTELAQRLANPKYNDCINLETDTILALLDMAQGGGWRPIESAPKDGTAILIYHPKGGVCEGFCPKEGWAWHVMDGTNTHIGAKSKVSIPSLTSYMSAPTHWQLLPAAPGTTLSDAVPSHQVNQQDDRE